VAQQVALRVTTFLHFLIVCVAGQAVRIAACDVLGAWDYGRFRPERIPLALFGGVVALIFIWFAVIPLGALTYALFRTLARRGVFSWTLWLSCGAAFGLFFGWLLGRSFILSTVLIVGIVDGMITAAALRFIWRKEVSRAA